MKTRSASVWLVMLAAVMLVPCAAAAQEATPANRKVVVKVQPQYPGLARAMKIQGSVRADVVVEPSGKVKSVDVKGGHPLLAQSAQDALLEWKWEPAAHETHQTVELRFAP